MSDVANTEQPDPDRTEAEPLYTSAASPPRRDRTRRFWIVTSITSTLLVAGITVAAIAIGSSGGGQSSNLMTLDSIVDTTPITEANSTTTEVTTTRAVDSSIPDTTVAVDDSLVPTTVPGSWVSVPQARPLRVSVGLANALNTGPPGTVFTYVITVTNPGEVAKPLRITAGYQQNGAVKAVAGLRVDGCPGWGGGVSAIYIGISNVTLDGAGVCTVSFDVATNPAYQGDLRAVIGVYDDYDGTEQAITAGTVFLLYPEATTTTITIPATTLASTIP